MTQGKPYFKESFGASTFRRRVLVSNELEITRACSELPTFLRGDALVGIATTTLWNLAAALRAPFLVGIDRSKSVAMQFQLYQALFTLCDTRAEFVELLLARDLAASHSRVMSVLPSANPVGLFELQWRHHFFGRGLTYSGVTLGDQLAASGHFASSDERYTHLRDLVRSGNTHFVLGDVSDTSVDLGGRTLRCLYLSNAHDYIFPSARFVATWSAAAAVPHTYAILATPGGTHESELVPHTFGLEAVIERARPPKELTRQNRDMSGLLGLIGTLDVDSVRDALLLAAESDQDVLTWFQPCAFALRTPREWLAFCAALIRGGCQSPPMERAKGASLEDGLDDWISVIGHVDQTQQAAIVTEGLRRGNSAVGTHATREHLPLLRALELRALQSRPVLDALVRLGESPATNQALKAALQAGISLDLAPLQRSQLPAVLNAMGIHPSMAWPDGLLRLVAEHRSQIVGDLRPDARVFVEGLGRAPDMEWALAMARRDGALAIADAQALALALGFFD